MASFKALFLGFISPYNRCTGKLLLALFYYHLLMTKVSLGGIPLSNNGFIVVSIFSIFVLGGEIKIEVIKKLLEAFFDFYYRLTFSRSEFAKFRKR